MWNRCLVAVAMLLVSAWVGTPGPAAAAPEQGGGVKAAAPATRPSTRPATPLPAGLAGDWFWGSISPTKYWDRDTGEFVGHGYSGALSYVFGADGTYKRYFYLEQRLGGETSGIFSASEGTVAFTGDTFTLTPAKGTYRFTTGRKKPTERPMRQDELERPGLVFTWRLEKKREGGGPPVLMISKEGEDARAFNRGTE
jgi:hypothetical protein